LRTRVVEGAELLLACRVVEAQHRLEVLRRLEALDRTAGDTLSR
jgi:hypothetical protein